MLAQPRFVADDLLLFSPLVRLLWRRAPEGVRLARDVPDRGVLADVRRALGRRRDALRALGIAPDDPRKNAKLREIERLAVGERMATQTSQQFLAKTPERFRGRVQAGSEAAPYVVVTDGARFVLVPSSLELRALATKTIALSRDAQGRLTIRADDRDRGR